MYIQAANVSLQKWDGGRDKAGGFTGRARVGRAHFGNDVGNGTSSKPLCTGTTMRQYFWTFWDHSILMPNCVSIFGMAQARNHCTWQSGDNGNPVTTLRHWDYDAFSFPSHSPCCHRILPTIVAAVAAGLLLKSMLPRRLHRCSRNCLPKKYFCLRLLWLVQPEGLL